MSDLAEFSLAGNTPDWVHVHQDTITDQAVKGLAHNLPSPTPRFLSVTNSHLFRDAWAKRQQQQAPMFVLIEHPENSEISPRPPAMAQVKRMDGPVLVLQPMHAGREPLPWAPRPGACVSLLLGIRNRMIDTKTQEKWEKEAEIRWI